MKLRITLNTPALFAGHAASALRVDETTARDSQGRAYIPGYAIKGALRAELERLLAGIAENETDRQACGLESAAAASTWLDYIFGSPEHESRVFISDAYAENEDQRQYGFGVRNGTGINRRLRTVENQVLFNKEILDTREQVFEANIDFESDLAADKPKMRAFTNTLKALVALGSDKSRGLGFCSMELVGELTPVPVPAKAISEAASFPIKDGRVGVLYQLIDPTGLSFLADAERQFLPTRDYLPGGTLRGAFAREIGLRPASQPTEPEVAAFVNPETALRFWNAVPVEFAEDLVFPVPGSAQTAKRQPGFRPTGWGVRDNLLAGFGLSLIAQTRFPFAPDLNFRDGEKESVPTVFSGFMAWKNGAFRSIPPPTKRVITRVGVTPSVAALAENLFYVHEVLDASPTSPLNFYGEISNISAMSAELLRKCEWIRLGRARSRGQGRVQIKFVPPRQVSDSISTRIDETTGAVARMLAQLFEIMPDERFRVSDRCFFSLTLMSDTLPDLFARVRSVQEDLPPLPLDWARGLDLRLEHWMASMTRRSGWNGLTGLPKPVVPALARGSTFLGSVPLAQKQQLCHALEHIENEGLGEERVEGFGQVSVCHPFHTALAFEAR
ncbi:MAG: hypothetical protein K1Y36_28175 [Blastocatellia bacterium]|nr:hypothetical protein [Blastocatellia bacterium]